MRSKQFALLKPQPKSYGGTLRNKRKGRGARPLAVKSSMHLILKSSQAKGNWSFKRKENEIKIKPILHKFSKKFYVSIESVANVGNHLHIHLKLAYRALYNPFIRAITSAIATAVTGVSRWKKIKQKFWDYRPFTRVVQGYRATLTLRDYMMINQLEGVGTDRIEARFIVASRKNTS